MPEWGEEIGRVVSERWRVRNDGEVAFKGNEDVDDGW